MVKRNNIYILYIIAFCHGLVFYGPVATLYRISRGLSMSQIFILEAILMILMLSSEVPWGYFSDRYGYKKTLIISYFLLFISKIIFYFADNFIFFLMEAILAALSFSGMSGCDSAFIYSLSKEDNSEKVFGRFSASGSIGFFAASIFATMMVKQSMNIAVLFTIIPHGLAFFISFFLPEIPNEKYDENKKLSLKESIFISFQNKRIFLFIISMALFSNVAHIVTVFLNQLQYERTGIPLYYFGILTAVMQILNLVSIRSYRLTERFGQSIIIKILLIVPTISFFLLGYTQNAYVSILLIALTELAKSIIFPIRSDIENKSITTENRATVLSVYSMISNIIGINISLLIGKVADISLKMSLYTCGFIGVIAIISGFLYYLFESKMFSIVSQNNKNF